MKRPVLKLVAICSLAFTLDSSAAVLYVDVNGTNPTPPYSDWSTAAAAIQDAVDAASDGDLVLVTNGVYQTGGGFTDMTNRVAVSKLITVQSVNGPAVTVIRGYQVPGTITGAGAVRGVYLASGATLSGFTVTGGATTGANSYGAGINCASSTDEIITNCVVTGNISASYGGGVYHGTLYNCVISQNVAATDGGGTYSSHLYHCLVTTNSASNGGGTSQGFLNNCVVAGNSARTSGGGTYNASSMKNCTIIGNSAQSFGGGAHNGGSSITYQNCIIYYNTARLGTPMTNVFAPPMNMYNCCVTPRISGNITNPPAFVNLAGGDYHLQIGSPCIDAGTNISVSWSADMDGNPRIVGDTVDIGAYENQNTNPVHYVSLSSTNPVPPYTNWTTAATNIQAAVAVSLAGEVVVAGDGTYGAFGTGGVAVNSETNRVALTNGITLMSLNGPQAAVIWGGWRIRSVYVGSNATLNGFTLTGGEMATNGGGAWCETNGTMSNCVIAMNIANSRGGGIYGGAVYNCTLTNNYAYNGAGAASASLFNCVLVSNQVQNGNYGGGAYQSTLSNCTLTANSAYFGGGGAFQSTLYNCRLNTNSSGLGCGGAQSSLLYHCFLTGNQGNTGGANQCTNYNCTFLGNSGSSGGGVYGGISYNCLVISNTASSSGGGAYQSTLYNCTVVLNMAPNYSGGGIYGGYLYNCIVYSNTASSGSNWAGAPFMPNCCTTPTRSDGGVITNPPSFVDPANSDFRLKCGSPGINAGNNLYVAVATDFNGNPRIVDGTVDMGACEFNPVLDLVPQIRKNFSFDNFAAFYPVPFTGQVAGCPDYFWWDFGDGVTITNQTSVSHAWAAPGTYNVVLTAYSTSLGYGLSATTQVSVVQQPVYYVNASSPSPAAPYSSWATAARYIQDAIRAGNTLGRLVLVTNGTYQGQVTGTDGTQWKNVILTNIVVVQSVNGPGSATIYNNPPYRVAYVGNNSILSGFTVTGGYATSGTDLYKDQSGGGLWCEPNGMVTNCIVTGNSAAYGGGGAYSGIFYDCVFSNNTVTANDDYSGGGGAYSGTFHHCYFVSNTVYGYNGNFLSGGGGACMSTLYDSCLASNQTLYNGRGGGALSCVLSNCTVAYNLADYHGGGAASSTLYHCLVRGNSTTTSGGGGGASCTFWSCVLMENKASTSGGGAGWSTVHNSLVVSNQAATYGGGLFGGTNYNCTIVQNKAGIGGGFYGYDNPSMVYNGIIYYNTASGSSSNWAGNIAARNTCSTPKLAPTGSTYGNITNDPVFVDAAFHLPAASPCRSTGNSSYAGGTDLDGEAWNSPPSMGADEVYDADFTGALSVAIQSPQTSLLVNRILPLAGQITGRASELAWSFGDGTSVSNASYFTSHLWTNAGDYSVVFTAYNTDNPGGVAANLLVHVLPLDPPLLQSGSFSVSSANGFQFQFNGQSNAIYTVQMATNLMPPIVWQNLQTITSTGGVVQVTDASATNKAGYYRVGVQ